MAKPQSKDLGMNEPYAGLRRQIQLQQDADRGYCYDSRHEQQNGCYWNNRHPLCPLCHVLWSGRMWQLPIPAALRRLRINMAGSLLPFAPIIGDPIPGGR